MGNLTVLVTIGIPFCVDPAHFVANLCISKHEGDLMSKLIQKYIAWVRRFHGTFQFNDDFCALNDGGEIKKSYKKIYPKELVLMLEHSRFWISDYFSWFGYYFK